ncbi:unnamed protein product [Mytilus coruscus]|uniref:Uncharacterized protein n=1 Tax=Mytilus coruscus TaxID=42192 RepID=A0A6J8E7J0_MYTCO|nr:unnamed protein product [Mytilus coruscus]
MYQSGRSVVLGGDRRCDTPDDRNIEIGEEDKPFLQKELTELLHVICRPTALLLNNPSKSASEHHIENFEMMHSELCMIILMLCASKRYILTSIPCRRSRDKDCTGKFTLKAICDKNQIKGSDARCIAVKLEKLFHSLFLDGKISQDIVHKVSSMVDIIHIAYSPDEKRSTRQVLHLFENIIYNLEY